MDSSNRLYVPYILLPWNINRDMVGWEMKGRFPANLLVSDNILDDGKIRIKGGDWKGQKTGYGNKWTAMASKKARPFFYKGDSGSYSRYFDLDAWWEEKQRIGNEKDL